MKKILIGYYRPSVILTYIAVISASMGIYFASKEMTLYSVVFLIISGICDAFDGKVARKCKRDDKEKSFGIEIDSLADMVSFIFLPLSIYYSLGMNSWYHVIIYTLYTLAGAIRLGYFNIIAMDDKEGPVSHYSGLPVTSVAIILPLFYLLRSILMFETFKIVYIILLLLIAILFVSNFKLKKPTGRVLYIFLVLGLVGIILLLGLCI